MPPAWAGSISTRVVSAQHTLAELRTHPGLVPALPARQGAGRGRGRERRRLRQAVPGQRRPDASCTPTTSRSAKVAQAIARANHDVGGRVIEMAETEYMVRGRGYLRVAPTSSSWWSRADKGTPVLVRDVARVELGPDERRGLTELNGEGEVVGGIAMARYGQNALEVIQNIKAKIEEVKSGAAGGRRDRHDLRSFRSDPSRHRHPEAHADRGKPHRRRWSASSSCCTSAARWWRS